ncbi:hypothetical protein [Pyrococcus abyssi]|uniref:Uncharacterized protein n=1 Tax=Pyrococcus abyssi (strain GE5 / Orsay) TaxID=272844 RepID=Q9V066_PYRAB|nr:hypothetical protein [Pyrococcus abyssi]CAB49840.1 Hypothetical protein PAB0621 [Pyrococcus abyssi GE5]CCE70334.1 TPA: hypothetical protein PAB0621 [Pyrococcus abyssi GE5]
MKGKSLIILLIIGLVILAVTLTRPREATFPSVTITPGPQKINSEEVSSKIKENLEGCFSITELRENPNFTKAKPVLSLLANNTKVYIFLYPNSTSALEAEKEVRENLGINFRDIINNDTLVFSQYMDYSYALIVAKGPKEDLETLEMCIVKVGPSPGKILYLFTPLGRHFYNPLEGRKTLESRDWLESKGVKISGYLDKLEGSYKGCNFAIFIYKPDYATRVYDELKKAFLSSGWKESRSFTLPSDFGRNPAGKLIMYSFLTSGDKVVYLELASFPAGHRVSLFYCNATSLDAINELW